MGKNRTKEKWKNIKMVLNYKKLNSNTVFYGYYIPNKAILFNRIPEPIGSQRWIVKADIGKYKWINKAFL